MLKYFGWHPAKKLFQWFGERLLEKTGDRNITFQQMYQVILDIQPSQIKIKKKTVNKFKKEYFHQFATRNKDGCN